MATFNQFNDFTTEIAAGTHASALNADTDVLKVYLTNTAPNAATHTVKADLAEITAQNGYPAGGSDIQNAATQTGNQITMTAVDVTFTASGGSFGPWRYAVVYNDTATNDNLVGWYDYGSNVTTNDTETAKVDFGASFLTVGS